jgi:inhibitor of cysteine peptidase
MKFIFALGIVLLSVFFLSYLSSWAALDTSTFLASNTDPMITLTQTDNGKSITLKLNQTLVISLRENPTTGFQWAIDPFPLSLLLLTASQYSSTSQPGLVGGGGQRILTFQAHKAGAEKLQIKLWRAWEGDSSIIDRFAVTVEVQS